MIHKHSQGPDGSVENRGQSYYCINSVKNCKNEEDIGALYFVTSSHFATLVHFKKYAWFRLRSSTHNVAHALCDVW